MPPHKLFLSFIIFPSVYDRTQWTVDVKWLPRGPGWLINEYLMGSVSLCTRSVTREGQGCALPQKVTRCHSKRIQLCK